LHHNLRILRDLARTRQILAVVKADAYGHGATVLSRVLEWEGVTWLAVAFVEEGVELRRSGVTVPILVFGGYQMTQLSLFQEFGLIAAVSNSDQLEMWLEHCAGNAASGRAGGVQPIHLKVDTGMARLGFAISEVAATVDRIVGCSGLRLDGIFSHFAEADDSKGSRTREQRKQFAAALSTLNPRLVDQLLIHLENSAALLHHALDCGSMVRCGLALFGIDPAGGANQLQPLMSVKSRVVQLKSVPKGTRSGYGGSWIAPRQSSLAVIPVGYADGYPRSLSNRAEVLIRGRRVPVVGLVNMDMVVIDVTGFAAAVGDEVVLMGKQGNDEISVYELSRLASTIPYEILTGFGLRLAKRYSASPEILDRLACLEDSAQKS
jgi:alanine racemase